MQELGLISKHYLYRHIRLDKNQPFYVGIGTRTKTDLKSGNCTRANSKVRRNIIWHRIVNKTSYEVEILFESNDYEFIKEKEKEFIKLYRRLESNGLLCNLTDGGDGTVGVVVSKESRLKRSIFHSGRKKSQVEIENIRKATTNHIVTQETKDKICKSKSFPILQFTLNGEFVQELASAQVASKILRTDSTSINSCAKVENRKIFTYSGFIWIYKKDFENGNIEKFTIALTRVKQGKIRKKK